jgi:hypothetical protein
VGLPYLLLAATLPLVQAWFARVYAQRSPYRLYALSNFGSLVGLLSYPLVVEPTLTTHRQGLLWSAAFGGYVVLCGVLARRLRHLPAASAPRPAPRGAPPESGRQAWAWWLLAGSTMTSGNGWSAAMAGTSRAAATAARSSAAAHSALEPERDHPPQPLAVPRKQLRRLLALAANQPRLQAVRVAYRYAPAILPGLSNLRGTGLWPDRVGAPTYSGRGRSGRNRLSEPARGGCPRR